MENREAAFNTICRICLSANKRDMVSLFQKNNAKVLSCYGIAVLTFAKVTIHPTDHLPTNMCQDCLFILKQAIRFKIKCEETHKTLTTIAKSQKKDKIKQEIVKHSWAMVKGFNKDVINHADKNINSGKDNDSSDSSDVWNSDDEDTNTGRPKDDDDNDERDKDDIKNITVKIENYDALLDELEHVSDLQSAETTKFLTKIKTEKVKTEKGHNGIRIKCSPNKDPTKNECVEDILDALEVLADTGDLAKPLNETVTIKKRDPSNVGVDVKTNDTRVIEGRVKSEMGHTTPQPKKGRMKPHKCELCDKVLSNKNTYLNHMQMHTGYKYICENCGKGYTTVDHLNIHLVLKHNTGTYMQCEHCDFKSPKRFMLIEHLRLHSGERPFSCEQCGLTFRRRNILVQHRKMHMEKSVKCDQCPRTFHTVGHMRAHHGSVHRRRHVFACGACGVTYAKRETVRRHAAAAHGTHGGETKIIRINRNDPNFPEQ
ncbi:zinc finger protein 37 isoform X1 [Plutella xylostella]|uniref:zinc finger protein 37 isoform X1 n=2 Tax=Plutella xylostella TaxID=51655 RepID=UPI0020323365|nr:zinc finger protein 37 isoform X1 [Plutella xylostella]